MRISLNGGGWQLKDYYGEDWRWRDAHKPASRDTRHWCAAFVPGSVHNDLWQAGEIPNPYFERNSLLLEWIPARTWLYKKSFVAGDELHGRRVQLCFEGLDYAAQFFLNGELLGEHTGMYTPAVFDVSDRLRPGEDNLIAVVVEPAPHEQPQVSRTSKVRTHKSRMTYWWDFCPRMIHVGIWDVVYLNVTGPARIEDVWVRPKLADDFRQADVVVSVELDATPGQTVEVETTLRLHDEIVAQQRARHDLPAGRSRLEMNLPVNQPRLWWPNGSGEATLYEAEVRVGTPDSEPGEVSDQRAVSFGFRRVELAANETEDTSARPYTLVVNGRKLYAKGWNWVPMDVMYGVPRPAKLERLLRLAQRAHVNLLRVWGGGLIETEAFYGWCDRLGILVWQEFIQSSSGIDNYPSESPEFIEMMVREAEQIIPRKRNHPSLALWCGGNELTAEGSRPLDDSHPVLAALKAVVMRLDPDRLWLPTSPSGRVFGNNLENIARDPTGLHDVHGPWEFQGVTGQYELYNQGTSLLHSEFGVEGITNLKTLNATIAPEHQQPVTLDNVYWHHLGAWWVHQPAWQAVFGDVDDVTTLARATQMMQAEGLRYALEADRRRKFHNSGTLPWQFNEPYPMAACTSSVDYYAHPKPAYYAVARAYEPVHVSAKFPTAAWQGREQFEADIWVNNSYLDDLTSCTLNTRIVGISGKVYADWHDMVACPANRAVWLSSVRYPLEQLPEAVFFLDTTLTQGDSIFSRNRYAFTKAANWSPLLAVTPTELAAQVDINGDDWHITLTNTGNTTALWVWLEDSRPVGGAGYVYLDDNHFCLFPGETRVIPAAWQGVPAVERGLSVSGWNTPLLPVPL
ncbi:MAG: hypothetical protein HZC41_13810 [Chloroflexi bacterium]|nr:hypothetical protein [Chloroflexota bacterium]